MKYIVLTLCVFFFPILAFSQSGPITINLKTGEQLSTNYAYLHNNSTFFRSYVRIDGKKGEKISIDRVAFIEGADKNGVYKYFKPIRLHGSEIWAERTFSSDRVDIYYTNIISGTWNASYRSKYFQYSKDGRPLKKLSYSNLKADLGDNAESMEHLKKGNILRITQFLFYGLGATLIGVGIAGDFNNDELRDPSDTSIRIPPALIAGAVSLYIPWFMNSPKQNRFIKALEKYQ